MSEARLFSVGVSRHPWQLELRRGRVTRFWIFRHRHLAVQFAARRGIRIEEQS